MRISRGWKLLGLFVAGLLPWAASADLGNAPPTVTPRPDLAGDAVAASNMTAYFANASQDRVAVLDPSSPVFYVPVGHTPRFIALGGNGFITSNAGDNTVSVQTTFTSAVSVPIGGSGPIVSDRAGKVAYVLRSDGVIVRVDTSTVTASTFDTGLRSPVSHALNGAGNRLYVADVSGEVRVFDITAASPAQSLESFHVQGRPAAVIALADPKLCVLTDTGGGSLVMIDLSSNAMSTFALPGGAQGPRTLINAGGVVIAGFANDLAFFDLATHDATATPASDIRALDYDFQSDLAFAVGGGTVYAIDPRTMQIVQASVSPGSSGVKFLYKPCIAYVAGPVSTLVRVPCGDLSDIGIRAHALWWVPDGAESGWGINIAHHGFVGILFATWFTYDANGQPTWLVMPDAIDVGRNAYQGKLYSTTGPSFSAPTFDPSKVTRTAVGSMLVQVNSVNSIHMSGTIGDFGFAKDLAREIFSSPVPYCDVNLPPGPLPIYQDIWWNPNESGWGLNIIHQGNILFITWFTYDTDGKPTWFVGSDIEKTGNATYSGTLYKTFGPPMTASPWDPSKVTRMPVGNATLTFRDDDNGTFAYTVSGISGSKSITREIFATPATRCR